MSETALTRINNYLRSDVVRDRFADIIGDHNAGAYIASVLLAVANSDKLQVCSPPSIYLSALRAATLRLSVDPSLGQAHLVPFKNNATLIVGYRGLHDLAVRTGRYRYINVGPVYNGEQVVEDRITGFHHLEGQRSGDEIIGWIGAFELFNGYAKTIYMTVPEIHEHAVKYSKGYNLPDGPWKNETETMERKTVLRLMLSRWGYLDPNDANILSNDNGYSEVIDIPPEPIVEDKPARSEDEILSDLGFAPSEATSKPKSDGNGEKGNGSRQWPGDLVKRLVSEGLAEAPKHAVNILNLSPFVDEIDLDYNDVVEWAKHRNDE